MYKMELYIASVSPATSGSNVDPFYSYYAKYGGRYQPGSALNYVRPRYNNDTYRGNAPAAATADTTGYKGAILPLHYKR